MWDDLSPFLVGAGPTSTVLDPDGTPNHILDTLTGGSVQVDWSFSGSASGILPALQFTVTLFADPVGPAPNVMVGVPIIIGPGNPGPAFTATFAIAPGFPVDAYRLTALITCVLVPPPPPPPLPPPPPVPMPIAGFVDGPIIQVRPGP